MRAQGGAPSALAASDTASNGVLLALGAAGIAGAVVVVARARGGSAGGAAPPPPSSGAAPSWDPQQSERAPGLTPPHPTCRGDDLLVHVVRGLRCHHVPGVKRVSLYTPCMYFVSS